tara:strand:- start:68 stop:331 length:264 start_codon:yes stop_codon:yes gene_type:complete
MKNINTLYRIITDVFEIPKEEIDLELSPADIKKWDSLAQLQLLSAVEKEFDITFEVDEIFSIYKIGDILALLQNRGLISMGEEGRSA